ncbi:MAG: hypothetical protein KDI01_12100, partial [Halioglobus sp.]|nr:hypothetical protein [Halioglobus sp.]
MAFMESLLVPVDRTQPKPGMGPKESSSVGHQRLTRIGWRDGLDLLQWPAAVDPDDAVGQGEARRTMSDEDDSPATQHVLTSVDELCLSCWIEHR